MKKILFLLSISLFILACGSSERTVSGEVFIATKGGANIQLGAVPVYVMSKPKADGYGSWSMDVLEKADFKGVTDSQGKFSITVPAGSYMVLVRAERSTLGDTERYEWSIPADVTDQSVSLSLNNHNLKN